VRRPGGEQWRDAEEQVVPAPEQVVADDRGSSEQQRGDRAGEQVRPQGVGPQDGIAAQGIGHRVDTRAVVGAEAGLRRRRPASVRDR
jgi:hypothetical protein